MAKKIEYINDINIRKTPQCIAILNSLKSNKGHPTANEILQDVTKNFPHMSLATVYNNLRKLAENNIIQELHVKNGPNRFDKNPTTHYHMICNQCGKMTDLNYPLFREIESFANQSYNFLVSNHEFNLYGICEKCQD